MNRLCRALVGLLLLLSLPGPLPAQESGDDGLSGRAEGVELREAMRRYFQQRLRSELSLSDSQMEAIAPRLQEIERTKQQAGRERMRTVQQLQRGLRNGATDSELQELLDRLEHLDRDRLETERVGLREVDEHLSVRQRVQLRFFVQRFRADMRRRVEMLRGDRQRVPGEPRRPR